MRIFNVVDFESLIYMKLYNLLILKKKVKKTMLRHWKGRNNLYFQDIYCHVNKFINSIPQYRRQILTISDGMFKVTT